MDFMKRYRLWLEALKGEEREELIAIGGDEKEIEDRFYRNLEFGTAGMRGIIGMGTNRINRHVIRGATQGLADYIKHKRLEGGVAIAYDSRLFSPEFAKDAALVLCKNGIKTYLFESLRGVPELSFALREVGAAAGIVITASHNPPEYNGYKVYGADGGQLAPGAAQELTGFIEKVDLFAVDIADEKEALESRLLTMLGKDMDEKYYARIAELATDDAEVRLKAGELKVVYTPLHGSGNLPVRRVLKDLGVHNLYIVSEQELPDPAFSTVKSPNPEDPDAFRLAFKLAREKGANVVIATDPDCDRLGVAVKDGEEFRVLTGNQIGCLLLDYLLARLAKKGMPEDAFAVKSIVSGAMADKIAAAYGIRLDSVLTGFRYIAEKIMQSEQTGEGTFVFGFEESYGFLSGTFVRDKDAAIAAMLVCEAAAYYATKDMTLYDGLIALNQTYGWHEETVRSYVLEGKDGFEKMNAVVDSFRHNSFDNMGGGKVLAVRDYKEGIRREGEKEEKLTLPPTNMLYFELEGARLIVRPSGTEPKLKVYLSAFGKDQKQADESIGRLESFVSEFISSQIK
ncbi:MAG: phospho-sugar mutase [Christensenellales bacterium]|jgi:phosphoglucomutase